MKLVSVVLAASIFATLCYTGVRQAPAGYTSSLRAAFRFHKKPRPVLRAGGYRASAEDNDDIPVVGNDASEKPPTPLTDADIPEPVDPVAVYTVGAEGQVVTNGVTFNVYRGVDCAHSYEHYIRQMSLLGRFNTTSEAAEYAREECTKDPICHSVRCHMFLCAHFSPACATEPFQGAFPEQSFLWVAARRTPNRKRLKDIALKYLEMNKATFPEYRPDPSLSHVALENTPSPFDRGEALEAEWRFDAASVAWAEAKKGVPRQADDVPHITVTQSDINSFLHHVLVDPLNRVIVFLMPKVASSELLKLYDRMVGHADFDSLMMTSAVHFRFNDPTRERLLLSEFSTLEATQLLNSPDYRKLVFFRDPKERALSAYLDKFLELNSYAVRVFRRKRKEIDFPTFLDYISDKKFLASPNGTGPLTNPHWRQQALVANVYKFLPLMDCIGWGDARHTKECLRKTGLWLAYGRSGWRHPAGFMQKGTSTDGHGTSSRKRKPKYFTSEEIVAKADLAYQLDAEILAEVGLFPGGPLCNGSTALLRYDRCGAKHCWPAGPRTGPPPVPVALPPPQIYALTRRAEKRAVSRRG